MKCTSLSLPSGAGGGASSGQSIATVRVRVTAMVKRMSRYLRICRGVSSYHCKGKCRRRSTHSLLGRNRSKIRGLGGPISCTIHAITIPQIIQKVSGMHFLSTDSLFIFRKHLGGENENRLIVYFVSLCIRVSGYLWRRDSMWIDY